MENLCKTEEIGLGTTKGETFRSQSNGCFLSISQPISLTLFLLWASLGPLGQLGDIGVLTSLAIKMPKSIRFLIRGTSLIFCRVVSRGS